LGVGGALELCGLLAIVAVTITVRNELEGELGPGEAPLHDDDDDGGLLLGMGRPRARNAVGEL
jgi:hypothetical protein